MSTMATDVTPIGPRWQEARQRAIGFAHAWSGERRERAEKDTFWNELLQVFGVDRRQVARFEAVARRYSTGRTGFIDLFWPGRILVEHKSRGASLEAAMLQALDYLPGMDAADVPRLIIVCDFETFILRDIDSGSETRFALSDLPEHVDDFGLMVGRDRSFKTEEDVNLEAAQLLTEFGDSLERMGYGDHERRVLLTRVLFCLFADDAAVWPTDLFEDFIRLRTRTDGSDLGAQLAYLFQLLNTPPERRRSDLADAVRDFIYVNGGLFAEAISIAECDARMRQCLLDASAFNWSRISPAIFGSMFQNALTPASRRSLGAHYTSEQNILRTIRPLFLDNLERALDACGEDRRRLQRFRDSLADLTFLDPACGCGNFLVVAYRELRRLELQCLIRLRDAESRLGRRRRVGASQISFDVAWESVVHVGQFYGIELEEWPCRIAEAAMHLTDHLANQELSVALGDYYARFPISDTAHIHTANALRLDWNQVLPAQRCSYVLGNPPFAGQKTRQANQTADLNHVWGHGFKRWLDYVSGWYRIAADYLNAGRQCAAAFVSTNSITQGEQVALIWQTMLAKNMKIDFAHRTFLWTNEARGRAQVHVVIVGFSHTDRTPFRYAIYDYPDIRQDPVLEVVARINPYLLPLPDVIVATRNEPLSALLPAVRYGNKPSDGGFLIVEPDDLPASNDPATQYIRRIIGARELTHGEERYCIWMSGPDADTLRRSQFLRERLQAVQDFRAESTAADTRKLASMPWRFFRVPQPTEPYLAIPRHVTAMRGWFTVAHIDADVIASDALFTAVDPDGFLFAILSSAMFGAWLKTVGGKIKSDPRFSAMVYNTFPLPSVAQAQRDTIVAEGQKLQAARAAHPDLTLASMYERLAIPPDILAAHRALDRAVDRAFGARRLLSTVTERMAILFPAYEQQIGVLTHSKVTTRPIRRRRGPTDSAE